MDILIVKLSALGDVLRTTALLRPLRRRYPGCRINWVTSRAAKPLLENNPFLRRVETLDAERRRAPRPYDLVLSMEEEAIAVDLADACGGVRIGVYRDGNVLRYTPSSAPYYDLSLLNRDRDGKHRRADRLKAANTLTYAELWLKVLRLPVPRGAGELAPILRLTQKDRRPAHLLARRWGLGRGAIGFNPGAGRRWPAKQLSVVSAARLLAVLSRLGRPLILFGGREEAQRNSRILALARRTPAAKLLRVPGARHGLRSFAGLVDLCSAVVTTDSLALHVAAALRKKIVVLVGPTSPSELDLFGRGEKITPEDGCACFYRPSCRLAKSCLDRLDPARITAAVERLLK